jgi:hypothetical protein
MAYNLTCPCNAVFPRWVDFRDGHWLKEVMDPYLARSYENSAKPMEQIQPLPNNRLFSEVSAQCVWQHNALAKEQQHSNSVWKAMQGLCTMVHHVDRLTNRSF